MTIYIRVYTFFNEISGEPHYVESLDGVSLNLSAPSTGEALAGGRRFVWDARERSDDSLEALKVGAVYTYGLQVSSYGTLPFDYPVLDEHKHRNSSLAQMSVLFFFI